MRTESPFFMPDGLRGTPWGTLDKSLGVVRLLISLKKYKKYPNPIFLVLQVLQVLRVLQPHG